eukprot:8967080-Karenia_brevis.AAC.1
MAIVHTSLAHRALVRGSRLAEATSSMNDWRSTLKFYGGAATVADVRRISKSSFDGGVATRKDFDEFVESLHCIYGHVLKYAKLQTEDGKEY